MLSPNQIRKRALNLYEAFLSSVSSDADFFPLRVFGSGLSKVEDYAAVLTGLSELRANSRGVLGYGYDIEWTQRRFRRFGDQQLPKAIHFPTRHDYTRFLGKCEETAEFERNLAQIVRTFPELRQWCETKPLKVVEHALEWPGLLAVCECFREHGRPNCYFRELRVVADTKFVERNKGILSELLPLVAPGCVGDAGASFELRFGFRQKQPLIRIRLLDDRLAARFNVPFCDFAVPLDTAVGFECAGTTVLVIENDMTFLTLPALPNTLAILGSGDAVSHLQQMEWLRNVRLLYWGDLDSHGFESLSILRQYYPHAESVLMDSETLAAFRMFSVKAAAFRSRTELRLTDAEREVFNCLTSQEILIEQERIPLNYATDKLGAAIAAESMRASGNRLRV